MDKIVNLKVNENKKVNFINKQSTFLEILTFKFKNLKFRHVRFV